MKNLLLLLLVSLFSCSEDNSQDEIDARLRITIYKNKLDNTQTLLLFTTIIHNTTGKNIFLIKSPPWYRHFFEKNRDNQFGKIPYPELNNKVMLNCVNSGNYVDKVLNSTEERKRIVDSLSVLNEDVIKLDYSNIYSKFKSQFLVLKKGETIEIDNTPIYEEINEVKYLSFLQKNPDDLLNRNKLGERMTIPKSMLGYDFWDGEITLKSDNIEVIFKETQY